MSGFMSSSQRATNDLDDLLAQWGILDADNEQQATNLLLAKLIALQTGEDASSYYEDGFESLPPGESDDGRQTAEYSSVEGLTAQSGQQKKNIGLTADTLVFRNVTDDLRIAFKDPDEHDDAWLTVTPSQAPFVIAGVYGIATSLVWFKQAASAGGSHSFDLLAVKRRDD